ncbi:MAG: hypothetical protein QNJ35_13010 [Paracoccaceae bacterium]|nr:hypothetical protein [Paracoccaceae bacterium]
MSLAETQRREFEERLKRINVGGNNTMGEVHIGPRDEVRANKMKRRSKPSNTVRMKPKKKKNVNLGEGSTSAMIVIGFLIGGFSMFAGQIAAFHFFSDGGLAPVTLSFERADEFIPLAHFAIAVPLAFIFAWAFHLKGFLRKAAVIGGLAAAFYYHGDLVERFPGTHANFFSEAYVTEILSGARSA